MDRPESDVSSLSLTDFDVSWAQEFEQMRSSLFDATAGRVSQIEHVGSTAFSRLDARPVIDLLAGLDDPSDADESENLITGLNYRRVTRPDIDARVRYLVRPRRGTPTHSVFLVEKGTAFWLDCLRFRDRLRTSPQDAWRYVSLRRTLADVFAHAPEAYEEAKLVFIRSVLGR